MKFGFSHWLDGLNGCGRDLTRPLAVTAVVVGGAGGWDQGSDDSGRNQDKFERKSDDKDSEDKDESQKPPEGADLNDLELLAIRASLILEH